MCPETNATNAELVSEAMLRLDRATKALEGNQSNSNRLELNIKKLEEQIEKVQAETRVNIGKIQAENRVNTEKIQAENRVNIEKIQAENRVNTEEIQAENRISANCLGANVKKLHGKIDGN